jgi:predicted LPLAT superfamily acyltransferase
MKKWEGKSKGTLLGYKIFVFFISKFGVKSAYFILYFVSFYYFLFLRKQNKAIFYYFNKRQGYSKLKSFCLIYKSYFVFGQTIIDKFALSFGQRNQFTFDFDGIEQLKELLSAKKGGILISAHVGNFEIAHHFFSDVDFDSKINLVTTHLERNEIKDYLDSISSVKSTTKFIIIKEDLSHIFEINNALENNELICFTGDRYFDNNRILSHIFLGKEAKFPAGPFLLASRLQAPVAFVYVMKEPNNHYHLYTRLANAKKRDEKALLENYINGLENILQKYPLQWFNYYTFWE